jgi:hypothetical protein
MFVRAMKTFVKAQVKDVNGTSFVGYLQADYEHMFALFSFPNDRTRDDEWRSSDKKTRFEWAFKIKGKKPTVITIYDYKDPRPLEDIDMWHVGLKGDQKDLEAFFSEQHLFVMINQK